MLVIILNRVNHFKTMEKRYSRDNWEQLVKSARDKDVRLGGYYEESVRSIFFWAGPDNHPDNWDDNWEFFYGDKDLYPEKRAFIGWVSCADWEREGDDGFDTFEVRSRNIQALKAYRDNTDWQTTEIRSKYINREEDTEWITEMFLSLFNEVFPEKDEPPIRISNAPFEVPEDFPSYLQPSNYRDDISSESPHL